MNGFVYISLCTRFCSIKRSKNSSHLSLNIPFSEGKVYIAKNRAEKIDKCLSVPSPKKTFSGTLRVQINENFSKA